MILVLKAKKYINDKIIEGLFLVKSRHIYSSFLLLEHFNFNSRNFSGTYKSCTRKNGIKELGHQDM